MLSVGYEVIPIPQRLAYWRLGLQMLDVTTEMWLDREGSDLLSGSTHGWLHHLVATVKLATSLCYKCTLRCAFPTQPMDNRASYLWAKTCETVSQHKSFLLKKKKFLPSKKVTSHSHKSPSQLIKDLKHQSCCLWSWNLNVPPPKCHADMTDKLVPHGAARVASHHCWSPSKKG